MKKKISLAGLVLSVCAFVAICVCGVYALSTLKLSIAGSITFDSSDCWVKITGNIEGSANQIADYEFFEKGLGKAKTWEIASIDFDRSQNNTIKINLSFENYSYYNVKVTISDIPESNDSFDVSVDYSELYLLEYVDGGVADKETSTITLTLKDGVDTADLPLALNVSFEKVDEIELSPYFTYTLSDTDATITGLTTQGQARTALEIPKQIDTLPVTAIAENSFKDNTNLARLKMPNTITSIGTSAFENCTSLAEVNIPTSLTTLSASAFKNCQEITSAELPNCVTEIGASAFYGCSSLQKATLPETLTTINDSTFYGCLSLKEINTPSTLTTIGAQAFSGCASLKNIIIPTEITSIGASAFSNCISVKTLDFRAINCSDFVSGSTTFNNVGDLNSELSLTIAEGVENIPAYLAESSSALKVKTLEIPTTVETIGDYAFSGCSYITGIAIPDNVTTLGTYAFFGCSGATNLTIGSGVASIGQYAFYECSAATEINYNATNCADLSSSNRVFYNVGKSGIGITLNIGDSVESIPAHLFNPSSNSGYAPKITSLNIGAGVSNIGNYAFAYCENIEEITIPDGVTTLGNYAFRSCSGLTSITIGEGVESIGTYAFYGCSGAKSLTIGSGVTSIGTYAFDGCTAVTEINYNATSCADLLSSNYVFRYVGKSGIGITVNIGDNVEKIPAYLFEPYNDTCAPNITNIKMGLGVSNIGAWAFAYCSNIGALTIPDSVTTLDTCAFYYCTGVTSLIIGSGIKTIGDSAFAGCSGLVSITIPNTVTALGTYAFSSCSSATSLTIGSGVISIGNYAFRACTAVTEINYNATSCADLASKNYVFYNVGQSGTGITVNIGDNVEKIPAYLFNPYNSASYAPNILTINIPERVTYIGAYAFAYCSSITTMTFEATTGWWYAASATATSGTSATPTLEYLTTDSTYRAKYWFRTV